MPMKPAQKCNVPTCSAAAADDRGRCRAHSRERERGTRTERGYGEDWQRLRTWFLAQPGNVCCVHCAQRGRVTIATDVDHIVPFQTIDDPLRLDVTNLQALCATCHDAKHAEAGRAARSLSAETGRFPWTM